MFVRIVELVLQKKKSKTKNVPVAEAKTPENDSSVVAAQDVSQEQTETPDAAAMPEFTLIEIPKVTKDQIEAAKTFGIPLDMIFGVADKINVYVRSVEQRFSAIETNMPLVVQNSMAKAIQNAQAEAQKGMPQGAAQQGGGGTAQLLLQLLGSGGGGADEEMLKLTKEMMSMNIQRLKQDMGFTDAIKTAIVSKIAGKAVTEII